METDILDFALGAYLLQKYSDAQHLVAYYSRKIIPLELNYNIYNCDGAGARHLLHCRFQGNSPHFWAIYQHYSQSQPIRIFHARHGKSPLARLLLAPWRPLVSYQSPTVSFSFFSLAQYSYIVAIYKLRFRSICISPSQQ